MQTSGLTIGDLAARTGLAVSAIRFYETHGIVTPYRNAGGQDAVMLVMTPGDERKRITWAAEVTAAAAQAGWGVDANGYNGLKRYIDRSQR